MLAQAFLAAAARTDSVAVAALVHQQGCAFGHGIKQGLGFPAVGDLATGQEQCDGATVSVNEGMDLAREATSGTSHAAIIGALARPTSRSPYPLAVVRRSDRAPRAARRRAGPALR